MPNFQIMGLNTYPLRFEYLSLLEYPAKCEFTVYK